MERNFNVIGIGEILWDIFPERKMLGGAPANFVFHSRALGVNSIIVSAVGNDILGKEIINEIKNRGINDSYLQTKSDYPTGTVNVKINEYGNPVYTIHNNVAWDWIEHTSSLQNLAKEADAVCFGTLGQRNYQSRETIYQFLQSIKKDCLIIFDINLRQNFYTKEIISKSLQLADCLKLNHEELIIISELYHIRGDETKIITAILNEYDLKFVALTKGEKGSTIFSKELIDILPAKKMKIVDTVGAGDAFTAALLVSFLRGLNPAEAHMYAAEMAAYVCTKKGAIPQMDKNLIEKFTNNVGKIG